LCKISLGFNQQLLESTSATRTAVDAPCCTRPAKKFRDIFFRARGQQQRVRTPRCVRGGKIQTETTASEPGNHLSTRFSCTLLYPVFSVNKFELCCISQALHLVGNVDNQAGAKSSRTQMEYCKNNVAIMPLQYWLFLVKITPILQRRQCSSDCIKIPFQPHAPPHQTTCLQILQAQLSAGRLKSLSRCSQVQAATPLLMPNSKHGLSGVGLGTNPTTLIPLLNPAGPPMLNVRNIYSRLFAVMTEDSTSKMKISLFLT
jgi:hypothetical protein